MLLGHIGLGLAGKKSAPKASLGTLVLAAEFADLIWIVLTLTGVEHFRIVPDYTRMSWYDMYDTPFSHGLLANAGVALAFGGIYFALKKDLRTSVVLAGVVVSHWVLDVISHRPDMVLIDTSWPKVGLNLWSSFVGTVLVETGLYGIGLVLYISVFRKKSRKRPWWRFVPFVFFCVFLMICSLVLKPTSDVFTESAACGIMLMLLVILAYWSEARTQTRPLSVTWFLQRKMRRRFRQTH